MRVGPHGKRREIRVRALPDQFEDADLLLLALDGQRIDLPDAGTHERRQRVGGRGGQDHLLALGERRHPRRDVDRIAEDVAFDGDRRTEMEADADREPRAADGRLLRDSRLHFGRRFRRLIGPGKDRHDLVADGLHDAAALPFARDPHERQAAADRLERFGVPDGFVELGAAAHVGEQHGDVGWLR